MKKIRSIHNQTVKKLCMLHKPKKRCSTKQFIAEGVRTCKTIIQANLELIQLYTTEEQYSTACTLTSNQHITIVSKEVMKKISTAITPSGILALFKQPPPPHAQKISSGIVLLELRDPGNVGALIRTCAAMGQKTVVCINSVDPWSPKVVQASAGSVALVDIFQWNWNTLIQHKSTLSLVALLPKKGTSIEKIKNKNILLTIGGEAHGIPASYIPLFDYSITLNMPGKIDSLNAAIAGSIAMYFVFTK